MLYVVWLAILDIKVRRPLLTSLLPARQPASTNNTGFEPVCKPATRDPVQSDEEPCNKTVISTYEICNAPGAKGCH
jgi:hypothetical protein